MIKIPFYIKISAILLGLVSFFFILYIASDIIVPLIFSVIVAILLNPVVNYLCKKRINRVVSITTTVLIMLSIIFGVFFFIGSQIGLFWEAMPVLMEKFNLLFDEVVAWVSRKFNIPAVRLEEWIDQRKVEGLKGAGAGVGQTIMGISSMLVLIFLVPVYVFLLLYYKPLIMEFISRIFGEKRESTVEEVLRSTKTLIQHYLVGLIIEMLIIATLQSTALLLIGVDYAIALGVIGAILNLIPYVGGVLGCGIPMLIALLSGTGMSSILVLGAYTMIQLIDNNFIVPMVVASKVQVNAMVSIIVVLIGGALWGVAGMFLAIPLTAIVKVLCDKIPVLSPLGYLIGDEMPKAVPSQVQGAPDPPAGGDKK